MAYIRQAKNERLNKYRTFQGSNLHVLLRKVEAQEATWEVVAALEELENILKHALNKENKFDWEKLKDHSPFWGPKPEPPKNEVLPLPPKPQPPQFAVIDLKPFFPPEPQPPQLLIVPDSPKITDSKYQPNFDSLENVSPEIKQKMLEEARRLYQEDYTVWAQQKGVIQKKNAELELQYKDEISQWTTDLKEADKNNFGKWEYNRLCLRERDKKRNAELEWWYKNELRIWETNVNNILYQQKENAELEMQYPKKLIQWEVMNQWFLKQQQYRNNLIDNEIATSKKMYLEKSQKGIINYFGYVLRESKYPDYFPKKYSLDYNPETKILILDYSLPSIDNISKIKEVKYNQSKDELVEILLSESAFNKLYDNLIYEITLRVIYELYDSDTENTLGSIVFNGWVESIDKATGQSVNACILSIQANRQEFIVINLTNVDPKVCFKNLKGVGSSKLHSLTPIAPILNISREDKRFVSSYTVVSELDESINIAAMDWEDFEHLIRELFEKEFTQSGGEVKVTQASRDGGVDAVAFDPDPIRGGKIVIQAKRYTNAVGVSAVRDLYGTMINEGAMKGILVTTADYGSDAYDFAKDKPITLLSGSNLLHLLEKHGHKAKIDLKEAKQILAEKEKESK
jgi:restriction system protein